MTTTGQLPPSTYDQIWELRFKNLEDRVKDLEAHHDESSKAILKGIEKLGERLDRMTEASNAAIRVLEKEDRDLERRLNERTDNGFKEVNKTIEDKTISKKEVIVAVSLVTFIITISVALLNKVIT